MDLVLFLLAVSVRLCFLEVLIRVHVMIPRSICTESRLFLTSPPPPPLTAFLFINIPCVCVCVWRNERIWVMARPRRRKRDPNFSCTDSVVLWRLKIVYEEKIFIVFFRYFTHSLIFLIHSALVFSARHIERFSERCFGFCDFFVKPRRYLASSRSYEYNGKDTQS